MTKKMPSAVLFVCSQNAIRSPMAAAITHHLVGHKVYVASAGVTAGDPDPFVGIIMDEIGLDLTRHRPHSLDDLADNAFDLVVTLSPEARQHVDVLAKTLAFDLEHWEMADPTTTSGNRDMILDAYRSLRHQLKSRITAKFS
jgi:protein-tyrosine-phosphatase